MSARPSPIHPGEEHPDPHHQRTLIHNRKDRRTDRLSPSRYFTIFITFSFIRFSTCLSYFLAPKKSKSVGTKPVELLSPEERRQVGHYMSDDEWYDSSATTLSLFIHINGELHHSHVAPLFFIVAFVLEETVPADTTGEESFP